MRHHPGAQGGVPKKSVRKVSRVASVGQRNVADMKREQIREQFWPGSSLEIFDRTQHNGFSTVPRIISLVLVLIEELAEKGKHPSRVYCELWFRAFDSQMIEIKDENEVAYACGLTVRRWKERIAVLQQLGFIRTKPAGKLEHAYILLINPYNVVKKLRDEGQIKDEAWWGAYTRRSTEIGYVLP